MTLPRVGEARRDQGELPDWPSFASIPQWRGEHQGDRDAFVYLADGEREARRLTYGELDRQARSVAAWLQQHELAGERVLLLYPPGLEFVIGFLGCLYAGTVAVPAYPPHPRRPDTRLRAIIEDCEPRAALCGEADHRHLSSGSASLDLPILATDAMPDIGAGWVKQTVELDSIAHLQYTSGSTGDPKGVMVSHRNLLRQSRYITQVCQCNADTVQVSWQPFFHDMGLLGSIAGPIFCGGLAVIMSPAAFLRSPIRWLRAISRYRGTSATAPNFAYDLCVTGTQPAQREGLDLSSWEGAWNGAEPIRADTIERFCAVFEPYGFRCEAHLPCYGMAETTLCTTASPPDRPPVIASFRRRDLERNRAETCTPDEPGAIRLAGSGVVGGGMTLAIVDPETHERCHDGQVGEIWVSGPSVALGYWRRPQDTEETFRARIAGSDEEPFLRTGDLGFLREGELFVTGRLKDMIILHGRNIYPQDLERVAEQSHRALQTDGCAAFSVEVDGHEALALALEVKRAERRRIDSDEIFEAVRAAIAEHLGIAAHWLGLVPPHRLPRTSSGKVMRRACRQQHLSGELELLADWRSGARHDRDGCVTPPVTGLVQRLRSLPSSNRRYALVTHLQEEIARALELRELPDPRRGFERLGIDSITAVRLVNRLQEQLEGAVVELPTTMLFDQPDIDAVARYLEGALFGRADIPADPGRAEVAIDEPVAVVGLACRFPGAEDADAFWRLLEEGRDAIREVPDGRWDISAHFDEDPGVAGKMYTRYGGFIDDIDGFDAPFFDMSRREAVSMDPQHRQLLEVSWQALEHAGIAPGTLVGRPVGVFVGISTSDYQQLLADLGPEFNDAFMATGNAHSAAVGRLSFGLGLEGPCMAVDTACSSSLVALHQAVQSLRHGECEAALAGGVNAVLCPEVTVAFCKARLLAPDGRCKTFDATADGYIRSEGCGMVVLKRLADAQRDGDRILAVIRGSAVNQDGHSSGLTAPSGPAQTRVIGGALKAGGVAPADVQYLECHGTGTVLGDPIEVQAANAIYAQGRDPEWPLLIGSVKTNIGHLEAAAGIAGMIKVVLALEHGKIPPSLHFDTPNPHIPWDSLAVEVAAQTVPWLPGSRKRVAGVSSFGFAGSNAHVVVEEAPERAARTVAEGPAAGPYLLALSARTESALTELAHRYATWLRAHDGVELADVCHTANTGRDHFEHRAVLVAGGRAAMQAQLDALARGKAAKGTSLGVASRQQSRRIAFLFPGEGQQYSGMARGLYEGEPVFRACLDRCAEVYDAIGRDRGSPALTELMLDPHGMDRPGQSAHIRPVLYSLQVSLAALWRSWGVIPDALLGHSAGEFAAACVAGVFEVEDGLRLVIERARLMQSLPAGGAMLSVTAPAETVEAILAGDDSACISAYNGLNTVISGPAGRLQALMSRFDEQGLYHQQLPATNAAHSMFVEPILDDFETFAGGIEYAVPSRTLISGMTGEALEDGAIPDAAYWRAQTRRPVRFAQAVQNLFESVGCDVVLELGPQAELMWLAQMCWRPSHKVLWTSSLAKNWDAREQMLSTAAQLHANGTTLEFARMEPSERRARKLAQPSYPFQHESYWAGLMGGTGRPGLRDSIFEVHWQASDTPPIRTTETRQQGWLILAYDTDLGAALATGLAARGQESVTTGGLEEDATSRESINAILDEARAKGRVDDVVLVVGPSLEDEADADAVQRAQRSGVTSALLVSQALIAAHEDARLWFVTRGTHAVLDDDPVDPTHAPVWGFGRTFAAEHPDRFGGLIDLPLAQSVSDAAEDLALALLCDDGENQVALRERRRWRARLGPGELPRTLPERLEADATFLITGGTGALGLALARHLAERGARLIVLSSRSGAGDPARTAIAELEKSGCRVEVVRADVGVRAQAQRLLDHIGRLGDERPLRGIIHAAGVLDGAPTVDQSPELMAKVMAPKVWGAWNLHRLTCDRGIELDFFVLFSSGASLLGLYGHSNYSAANAYLDSLAQHRRGQGLPALSINWGPWADDGMATHMEAGTWEDIGTRLIPPRTAMYALDRLTQGRVAQVCVQPMNLTRWSALAASGRLPPVLLKLLESLLSGVRAEVHGALGLGEGAAPQQVGALVTHLRTLGPGERRSAMQAYVRERVGAVLGTPPEDVDPQAGFFDLGMNSIMAVELRSDLQTGLGSALDLQAAVVFNHPTVEKISSYLTSAVFGDDEGGLAPVLLPLVDSAAARVRAQTMVASDLASAIDTAADEILGREDWDVPSGDGDESTRERKALAALLTLRAEIQRLQARASDPVAVIGLSCRYPGGDGPDAFWQVLDEGRDAISDVPPDRWDIATYYDADPDAPGKMNTRQGGFVSGIDLFDADFFDVSPREARTLDPQQRMLLEISWEALEDANVAPRRLRGIRGGVFVGISVSDYAERVAAEGIANVDAYVGTGNALCAAAGRLAFTLGWQGPALAIDTACSSSLVSLHEACASLRGAECDIALAGGVSLVLNPTVSLILSKAHMLSPDDRCKTFDAAANGYVRGEGCGMVVLKRLSDAQRDGDRVLAVIRGSAVNQDGRSSGLTVPNGLAQERVIVDALNAAGVEPAAVQYLEAHGTGTPLGDPIEIQAADAVLSRGRDPEHPLIVGSVKTNIGHTESAAGIAGVIKVILAMQHGRIPRSLHFATPNPHIPWAELKVRVAAEPIPWPAGENRRIASVSSFGFVGTNAHVVLEEAPAREVPSVSEHSPPDRHAHLLAISARTGSALAELARHYVNYLGGSSAASLPDVCYTANSGRDHFEHRAAMVFEDDKELRRQLAAIAESGAQSGLESGRVVSHRERRVAFLFTGQGSQYAGMGRGLYEVEPVFRAQFDRCAAQFERLRNDSPALGRLVFEDDGKGLLDQTEFTQPALYALEVSLLALLQSWGVEPHVVLGHSVGEYAAAYASGVFSLEDGMALIIERGRLMQGLPTGGAMVVVSAPAATIEQALGDLTDVCIGAYNGADTVISGGGGQVDGLVERFEAKGIRCRRLVTSHAFHSARMEPILDEFRTFASGMSYRAPNKRLISNVTGEALAEDRELDAEYWTAHVRRPVQFERGVRSLQDLGCDTLVEIGPHPVLIGMAQRCWDSEQEPLAVATLRRRRRDTRQLLAAAALMHTGGVDIDLAAMDTPWRSERRKVPLPVYPFQRRRYWVRTSESTHGPAESGIQDLLYTVTWEQSDASCGPASTARSETWLILTDRGGIGAALCERLESTGRKCVCLVAGEDAAIAAGALAGAIEAAQRDPSAPLTHVVHLWSLDDHEPSDFPEFRCAQNRGVLSAHVLAQHLVADSSNASLWLVTRRVHRIVDDDTVDATHAPVWGLGKSIAIAHPEIWGGMVDLPADADVESTAEQILQVLGAGDGEDHVALRRGQRWVARLAPAAGQHEARQLSLDAAGSYLITGGLGAIGLQIAARLVERGARHLILVGRSAPDATASAIIGGLREKGCEVNTFQADIGREIEVPRLFDEIEGCGLPEPAGIFHAAGVTRVSDFDELSIDRFVEVMAPKVWGGWLLEREVRARGIDLSLFVCMSSVASVLGAGKQADYAAANLYLDALMSRRRAEGMSGCSINFGPWGEAGMSADEETSRQMKLLGFRLFKPAAALDAMEAALGSNLAGVVVADVNWSAFRELAESQRPRPLLEKLDGARAAEDEVGDGAPVETPLVRQLTEATPDARLELMTQALKGELSGVLEKPAEEIDDDMGFFDLGMDSIMALEFRNGLSHKLGRKLSATLVMDRPVIGVLAAYLAQDLLGLSLGNSADPVRPRVEETPEVDVTEQEVEALSSREVVSALDDEIKEILGE